MSIPTTDEQHQSRRVLITGGSGFVAAHLVRRCLARGDDVHVMVRATASLWRLSDVIERITVHIVEFSDAAGLARCFEAAGPDEVFHLAVNTRASAGPGFQGVLGSLEDLANLLALVSAAAATPHPPRALIRAGSIAEYGFGAHASHEDQREAPVTAYAASLVAGTHCLQALSSALPFRVSSARLALIYGAGQSESFFIPYCLRRLSNYEHVTVARPRDRRDLLYIDDAIEGLLAVAANEQSSGGVFNLATGLAPETGEVATMIAKALGAPTTLISKVPNSPEAPAILLASPQRTMKMLKWQAKTTLLEGLARTVEKWSPADRGWTPTHIEDCAERWANPSNPG